jgi:hypothetical protein
MDDVIPTERANRDFRVKFPDDVMQENLAGQLWFGAEVSTSFIALSVTVLCEVDMRTIFKRNLYEGILVLK